jgi:hypothetical protein
MNITHFKKQNTNDSSCAPVCLRMALSYFDIEITESETHKVAHSIGESHYTLPWGLCLGAASQGVYITFVSKNTKGLLQSSVDVVANITQKSSEEIDVFTKELVRECDESKFVTVLDWKDKYKSVIQNIVLQEAGVVVPTVWWELYGVLNCHNIVITKIHDNTVTYSDPNEETGSGNMEIERFNNIWIHENTDNDFLVISKDYINIEEYV